MRLHLIELVGEYKSIKGTTQTPFSYDFKKSKGDYSPLCLVGLNGSGKSNLIELVADIFGYSDRYFNSQYQCIEDLPYDFFLSYQITINGNLKFIKLICKKSKIKMYEYEDISHLKHLSVNYASPKRFQSMVGVWLIEENFYEYFPKKIIAYSSGLNQGLSSVFAKAQHSFFDVVRKQGVFFREYTKKINKLEGRDFIEDKAITQEISRYIEKSYLSNPALFYEPASLEFEFDLPLDTRKPQLPIGTFSDHSVNQLIFISLMVNENTSFKRFLKEYINIIELTSFEIDFRLIEYRDLDFIRSEVIERLYPLSCNTSRFNVDTLTGVMEFQVDQLFFTNVERLYLERGLFFENLLFINQMAAKRWSRDEKRILKISKYERNVPNVSGGLAPIRFINTKVKLVGVAEPTLYDRLSDGEHQLIQIIGSLILFEHQQTLFILDEPESHFNPEWKVEFVNIINQYVNLTNLELIISTHSPFILSACQSNRVLHCKKNSDKNVIISELDLETYGASFDSLLTSVFNLDVLISKKPIGEIRQILGDYDSGNIGGIDTLNKLKRFGESFELNYRRNKINRELTDNNKGGA